MKINYLAIIGLLALPTGQYAGASEDVEIDGPSTSTKMRTPPMPPPPPLAPCPPPPPDGSMNYHCESQSLAALKHKYLQTEGHSNRGLNFYYFAGKLFSENLLTKNVRLFEGNYSLTRQTLFDELGNPDYAKRAVIHDKSLELYAYRFDYKGNKDYMIVVSTSLDGSVVQTGYTETRVEIDNSWREFN